MRKKAYDTTYRRHSRNLFDLSTISPEYLSKRHILWFTPHCSMLSFTYPSDLGGVRPMQNKSTNKMTILPSKRGGEGWTGRRTHPARYPKSNKSEYIYYQKPYLRVIWKSLTMFDGHRLAELPCYAASAVAQG